MKELWKPVLFDTMNTGYEVSSLGNVKSIKFTKKGKRKEKILQPIKLPNGYLVVTLCVNGTCYRRYIHRLVATAFISNPDNKPEVNHINGEKTKNDVSNLEWVTSSENKLHAYNTNLQKNGENNIHAHYTEKQIRDVCKYIEENELTPTEIFEKTGVKQGVIADIRNYGSWTHISKDYDFSMYTPKQKKYTAIQYKRIREMWNKNASVREISDDTGIPYKSVWYLCKKIQIENSKIKAQRSGKTR